MSKKKSKKEIIEIAEKIYHAGLKTLAKDGWNLKQCDGKIDYLFDRYEDLYSIPLGCDPEEHEKEAISEEEYDEIKDELYEMIAAGVF